MFRGIAIIMVLVSHYAAAMYVEPMYPELREFIATWGIYGVDIFFLLSGYGLTKSADKNGIDGMFVLKRFVSAYLPYFFIVGICSLVDKAFTSWTDVFRFLIGYDYWYMAVLFSFYIMFMIFGKCGKFRDILLTAGIILFTWILRKKGMSDFWELSNGAFLIGVFAASLENRFGSKVGEFIKKSGLCSIAIVFMFLFGYIYSRTGEMWAEMTRSMCFSVAALALCVCIQGGGIILPVIGKYSLYIYLLHLRLFWKFVYINENWDYVISAAVAGVLTLVICVAVGFATEYNLNLIIKVAQKKKSVSEQKASN